MIRSLLTVIVLMSAATATWAECPNVAGDYEKIAGTDGWTDVGSPAPLDDQQDLYTFSDQQITFPATKFNIIQDETCMATLYTRNHSYFMKYVPSKSAYVNTYKGNLFVFTLSISPNQQGVSMTYSRKRTFLSGVAPTYSHWASFKKLE